MARAWAAVVVVLCLLWGPGSANGWAEDWPMWGYNAARTGRSPIKLPKKLHLQWVRQMPRPRRAWPKQLDDGDKLEFDASYSPIVVGDQVFVPSMVTDSLTSYDLETGRERWRHYADGPVRLAPAAWKGRVYFVSDDGHLTCLDAADGALRWKFNATPAGHRVLGNTRVISMWPARGGPVILDGTVYFAAGVWPFLGTFVYAVDAETGDRVWANTGHATQWQAQPHGGADAFAGLAPQGYLAAAGTRLVVAGGRSFPAIFDRRDGSLLHSRVRGPKGDGGYRVRIHDGHYYNHGRCYRLRDGAAVEGDGLPSTALRDRVKALEGQLDGEVFEFLAARKRLFVVTRTGTIFCFGPGERPAEVHEYVPQTPRPRPDAAGRRAEKFLRESGAREGYALFLGAGDGDLVEQVAVRSRLHVVAIEPDATKVAALRRRFDDAGLYGNRIALLPGNPAHEHYPKYISSLIVMEDPSVLGRAPDAKFLRTVYDRLRPYDGMAVLRTSDDTQAAFAAALAAFEPEAGGATLADHAVVLTREGALPGSGQWTHQYADSAQSVVSRDERVRPPFGPIWFGGPTHDHVLPRHAAGPRPQVAGGRLVILGVETISARCVFTGREIWVREFPGIGHPFTNLELEEQWRKGRQVYMTSQPGAAYIGSPYVTLPDAIYLRYRGSVFRLDPATGKTVAEWPLPARPTDREDPDWGHISVHGDWLVTTTNPQIWRDGALGTAGDDSWDGTSSGRLVVLNRHTGQVAWTRDAEIGFRHTAIASGNGRLFVSDRLSTQALKLAQRRGLEVADKPRLSALDIRTGDVLWTRQSRVFGTFFSYSEAHDILIEGGSHDTRFRLRDEPDSRMIARRGADGEVLWERKGRYDGPVILHGDTIIPARPGPAIALLTGEDKNREHPVTGQDVRWSYWKAYGCGTANASTHLLLFRSGAAGFADLTHDGGTGTLGGFKSGCTASLIPADGVLNAPDYTRTCTCSYQNQTSLGLIHMPEMEVWTANRSIRRVDGPITRLGVNLGAPGNRRADNGTLWIPSPPTKAPAPDVTVLLSATDFANTPVRVLAVAASTGRGPAKTLDGDPSTRWVVRADDEGQFDDWIRYELSKATPLDHVEVAWTGPEATQFRIDTSPDGKRWTTAIRERGVGPGEDRRRYPFEPVKVRFVRLVFGAHGDVRQDKKGKRLLLSASIAEVRIGGLTLPNAYGYFRPKEVYRKHSLFVDGTHGLNWVAASGVRSVRYLELPEVRGGRRLYTVILHFVEPDALRPGQRAFDIYLQGARVATGFDIVRKADGPDRAITQVFTGIPVGDSLCIELKPTPRSERPPVLSGVELVQEP